MCNWVLSGLPLESSQYTLVRKVNLQAKLAKHLQWHTHPNLFDRPVVQNLRPESLGYGAGFTGPGTLQAEDDASVDYSKVTLCTMTIGFYPPRKPETHDGEWYKFSWKDFIAPVQKWHSLCVKDVNYKLLLTLTCFSVLWQWNLQEHSEAGVNSADLPDQFYNMLDSFKILKLRSELLDLVPKDEAPDDRDVYLRSLVGNNTIYGRANMLNKEKRWNILLIARVVTRAWPGEEAFKAAAKDSQADPELYSL
eukprot:g14774.t1